MAIVTGDLIKLVHYQRFVNQSMLNVYTYEMNVISGTLDYGALFTNWVSTVQDAIAAVQATTVSYERITIENLTNGADFFNQVLISQGGSRAIANPAPPFISVSIELRGETRETRPGFKRYSGIDVDDFNQNGVIVGNVGAYTSLAGAIRSTILVDVTPTGEGEMIPVIIGRDVEGNYQINRFQAITSSRVVGATSQNSRKIGKGS